MVDPSLLRRITSDPEIFGDKPIVHGQRISVELVLSLLAQAVPQQELLQDYPSLEAQDIKACLALAHAVIANDSLDDIKVG